MFFVMDLYTAKCSINNCWKIVFLYVEITKRGFFMSVVKSNEGSFSYKLFNDEKYLQETITQIVNQKIVSRIWQRDYTVWKNDPKEISNRLGWLDCIEVTKKSFDEINDFVAQIKSEGFTNALLLGMGGSSLAPEVFVKTFGIKKDFLELNVLDSTSPDAVLECTQNFDPSKTLYIVSTKSGGTIETISFMKYFYNYVSEKLGHEKATQHFIAITDPGSGLQKMAEDLKFRKIFLSDPNIGGRFSALSLFGTIPAALIGVDINLLFDRIKQIVEQSKLEQLSDNTCASLGAIISSLAELKKDKLTFILSDKLNSFGAWVEQLIAESTGKEGKGILPVDSEPLISPDNYSKDRVFVYIKTVDDTKYDKYIDSIESLGFPVIRIIWNDLYDLGSEFFRWEFATALAGWKLNIQPYDQPNVESAKIVARKMIQEYEKNKKLPELKATTRKDKIVVYGEQECGSVPEALEEFFAKSNNGEDDNPRSYVAIQAYIKPDDTSTEILQRIREKILMKYKFATTLGYGPRFLHSTGQLHKGDSGVGLFIQIITSKHAEVAIPENPGTKNSSFSFGVLINSQALGDRQALLDNNRNVITILLEDRINDNLNYILESI